MIYNDIVHDIVGKKAFAIISRSAKSLGNFLDKIGYTSAIQASLIALGLHNLWK